MIIDGHNAIRSGRFMTSVQKMLQNSESPTKPQVTFAHLWGVCSVLVGSEESKLYPIPVSAEIQSGDETLRRWETESKISRKSDEGGFVLSASRHAAFDNMRMYFPALWTDIEMQPVLFPDFVLIEII